MFFLNPWKVILWNQTSKLKTVCQPLNKFMTCKWTPMNQRSHVHISNVPWEHHMLQHTEAWSWKANTLWINSRTAQRRPHLPLQRGLGEDWGRAGPRALGLPLLLTALAAAPQEGPVPIAVATFTVATGQPVVAFWQPTLQRLGTFLERSSPELKHLTRSSFGTVWLPVLARLLLRGCRLLLASHVLFLAGFWFFLTVSILLRRSWCLFQKQFRILISKALLGFSVLPPPAASPRWLIIGRKTVTGKDLFVQTRRTGWRRNFWFLFTFY